MKIFSVILPILLTTLLFINPTVQLFLESSSGDGAIPDGDAEPEVVKDFNRWLLEANKEITQKPSSNTDESFSENKNEDELSPTNLRMKMRSDESPESVAHTNYLTQEKQDSFAFRFQEIEVKMNHPKPLARNDRRAKILCYIYKILQHGKELTGRHHQESDARPHPEFRHQTKKNIQSTTTTASSKMMDIDSIEMDAAAGHNDSPSDHLVEQ